MPIPFPISPPTAPTPGAGLGSRHWLHEQERYAAVHVEHSHVQALLELGEYALITLMWHDEDHRAGYVDPCPVCNSTSNKLNRISDSYRQPTRERCPSCYGTRWLGGIRAQIVRPTLWTDSDLTEDQQTARGEINTDTMRVESTGDFDFRAGDYIFRSDGTRYQGNGSNDAWIRTGLGTPQDSEPVGSFKDQVRLEDPSSVAYLIPPSKAVLAAALNVPAGTHFPVDFSSIEVIHAPLSPPL